MLDFANNPQRQLTMAGSSSDARGRLARGWLPAES